jgi:hypothetical protein
MSSSNHNLSTNVSIRAVEENILMMVQGVKGGDAAVAANVLHPFFWFQSACVRMSCPIISLDIIFVV